MTQRHGEPESERGFTVDPFKVFRVKFLSTTTLGLVAATLLAVACANSEEPTTQDIQPSEPASAPASTVPPTAKTPPKEEPAKVCVSSCQNDSQCASSCPDTAGAIACCDTQTGTCYASKQSTCPAPVANDDAGTPSY